MPAVRMRDASRQPCKRAAHAHAARERRPNGRRGTPDRRRSCRGRYGRQRNRSAHSSSRSQTRASRPPNGRKSAFSSIDRTSTSRVISFDSEPQNILVSQSRRDADLNDTDSIRILLDTFNDGQNAFVFGTNPFGIEYDGQVMAEGQTGQGGRGQRRRRVQRELGRRLDGARADDGARLGSGVRHSAQDAALQPGRGAHLGRQRHAQHPAEKRAGLPVAGPARLQPASRLGGRQAPGPEPAGAPRPQAAALRRPARSTTTDAADRYRPTAPATSGSTSNGACAPTSRSM